MSALKTPVLTTKPVSRNRATTRSYASLASSGGAARTNDGRLPRLTSATSVTCERAAAYLNAVSAILPNGSSGTSATKLR